MKMMVEVIRSERLQCVKDSFHDAEISGMTITHVSGCGKQREFVFTNRVSEFVID